MQPKHGYRVVPPVDRTPQGVVCLEMEEVEGGWRCYSRLAMSRMGHAQHVYEECILFKWCGGDIRERGKTVFKSGEHTKQHYKTLHQPIQGRAASRKRKKKWEKLSSSASAELAERRPASLIFAVVQRLSLSPVKPYRPASDVISLLSH